MSEPVLSLVEEFQGPQVDLPLEVASDQELFGPEGTNPPRFTLRRTTERFDMLSYYGEIGMDGAGWYASMRADFLSIFRDEENADMFIKFLAATSPNNDVETNVHYAMKAYSLWIAGGKTAKYIFAYNKKLPADVFRGFMSGHADNIVNAIEGRELSGPKVNAFTRAMFGDEHAVVIDRWMLRAVLLPTPTSGSVTVTLKDGSKIKGKGNLVPGGVQMDLPKDADAAVWTPKKAHPMLFVNDLRSEIEQGTRTFFLPYRIVKPPKEENLKFQEKSISAYAYSVIADFVAEVAIANNVAPRDFQAAVWTGIKIVQDPRGLENFVDFYTRHYGTEPPTRPMLEEIRGRQKFAPPKKEEEEELLPFEESVANNPDDRNEVDFIYEDAASMLQ